MGEQKQIPAQLMVAIDPHALEALRSEMAALRAEVRAAPVSYTHLTLPTSDLV